MSSGRESSVLRFQPERGGEGSVRAGGEDMCVPMTDDSPGAPEGTGERFAQMKRNGRRVRFQDVQSNAGIREHAMRSYLMGTKD